MSSFKHLFGISETDVQKNCILLPYLPAGVLRNLGIEKLQNGLLFSSASNDNYTVIKTRMGASFVGDAVLGLKGTPCKNIFFFGSCGLINQELPLTLGSCVVPQLALGWESFSHILLSQDLDPIVSEPNSALTEAFPTDIQRVTVASFASIALEEDYLPLLKENNCDVVEMECAAFFLAAKYIKKTATALLFVSDIPQKKSLTEPPTDEDKKQALQGIAKGCQILLNMIAKQ